MVFAQRNLLQRGGMKDDVYAADRLTDAVLISHVADDEIQRRFARILMAHAVFFGHSPLLVLIAAEDPYLRRIFFKQAIDDLMPKRACPAGYEDSLTCKRFSGTWFHHSNPLCPSHLI